jgi:hypothetical protein
MRRTTLRRRKLRPRRSISASMIDSLIGTSARPFVLPPAASRACRSVSSLRIIPPRQTDLKRVGGRPPPAAGGRAVDLGSLKCQGLGRKGQRDQIVQIDRCLHVAGKPKKMQRPPTSRTRPGNRRTPRWPPCGRRSAHAACGPFRLRCPRSVADASRVRSDLARSGRAVRRLSRPLPAPPVPCTLAQPSWPSGLGYAAPGGRCPRCRRFPGRLRTLPAGARLRTGPLSLLEKSPRSMVALISAATVSRSSRTEPCRARKAIVSPMTEAMRP